MKKTHKPVSKKTLPRTKKQRKTPFPPIYIIGLVILILASLAYIKNRPNNLSFAPIEINQVGDANGVVDLTLTPATSQVEPGGELVLTLTAKPGSYKVGDITVELDYDPAKVGTPVLTQGSYLTDKMGTPTVTGGKINFEYIAPTSGLATGEGTVATIKLFPTGSGTTNITFTEKTEVVVVDPVTGSTIPSNMLKSVSNATITIGTQDSASPSPSDNTTVSPSPSASVTPSTTPEKPAKPTGLSSSCNDDGSKITFRWDSVTGASSYKLRMNQLSGSDYKSIDGITETQSTQNIIANQKYSWWVHTTKDGIDSEEAKIDEVICSKTSASSPTPTPTSTPKSPIKPSTKATATPKPSPTSTTYDRESTVSPNASLIPFPSTYGSGSLNDIFADKDVVTETSKSNSSSKPGFFQMIALGWKAIFDKLAEIIK